MAVEQRRTVGKTDVLSMRIDPKTRFKLDIIARARGQSISTVVERAIADAADTVVFADRKTWKDYWDVSEVSRFIRVAREDSLFPTWDEDLKLQFMKAHWEFFYTKIDYKLLKDSADLIWPHIDRLVDLWNDTKSSDYFAAGREMSKILSDAKVAGPEWPRVIRNTTPTTPSKLPPQEPDHGSLDDEIPF